MNLNPISGRCLSKCICIFFLFISFFQKNITAQPAGFTDQLYMGGWNELAGFTWDVTGKMYVWERDGRVWIVENGVKSSSPLIDISDEVGGWRDFGLLGFALDPNFISNGYFYMLYVVDRHHLLYAGTPQYSATTDDYFDATIGRITRYQADPTTNYTTTLAGSRFILLGEGPGDGPPILHESHGTGSLVFGDDGTLLATIGDGASYSSTDQGSASETYWQQGLNDGIITTAQNIGAYRCQTLDNYSGKILRLDPMTGEGLPSNPFWNGLAPKSPASRTWARGVRNPYRMTLKPGSGSHVPGDGNPGVFLFGDVGWGTREELNVVTGPGMNFGWPKYEGMTHQPGYNNSNYTPAQHDRPKVDWRNNSPRGLVNGVIVNVGSATLPGPQFLGNASTGGVWFHGEDFPEEWHDTYFQADYGAGWIRNFKFDANWNPVEVKNFINDAGPCIFLNTDPDQTGIYYIRWPNQIRKVSYTGTTNHTPLAFASADVLFGTSPLTVQFSSENTYDEDLDPLTFLWDFGDGNTSTQPNPVHTFSSGSSPTGFIVTLTVTDDEGLSDLATLNISLNNTPPTIVSTSLDGINTFSPYSTSTIELSANVTDPEHSAGQLSYFWEVKLFHNNHNHPIQEFSVPMADAIVSPVSCYGPSYWYQFTLTVTDPTGASDFYQKDLYPACAGNIQTITFDAIDDKEITDGIFTINASASSGLPVVFYIKEGPASVIGNIVTLDGVPGKVTVTATQPGDGNFAPAYNVDRTFFVNVGDGLGCMGLGQISRDVWTGVSGTAVADIPLGQAPNNSDLISIFEVPVNVLDNYGSRVRGFICPPMSGNYRFWISSDDNGELWLSTDENAANKTLIANVPSWTNSRQWDKFPEQQSVLIPLNAGQLYYVEALMKEQGGGDNLAVGWQLPNGVIERPIPGTRLLPFGAAPPTALFNATPTEGDMPLLVSFDASGSSDPDGSIVDYSWNFGDGNTGNGISPTHTYTSIGMFTATLVVTDDSGKTNYFEQEITVNGSGAQDQTISFAPIPDKLTTDADFTISANASSGLQVSFSVVSGPATIIGNTITLTGLPGSVTIRALQAGDANWNPAVPVDRTFSVTEPSGGGDIDLELSVTSSSPDLHIYDNISYTFTLENNGTEAATGVAVFIPKPATVVWVGGSEYTASQGSYGFSSQQWNVGSVPAGGNATITVNWFVLASDPLSGWAGVMTADQDDVDSTPGNGVCCTANEDDEAGLTVSVPGAGPQNQTITFSNIPNKESDDPPFSISASATSGLPVSLSIISGPATIAGNTITLDGTTGTVIVLASQNGNADWNPAPDVQRSFQVNEPGLEDQVITFGSLPNKSSDSPPFDLSATASSGLPVSFSIVSGPATIAGNTVTLDGTPGTVVVRAGQVGDAQYNPAPNVDRSFTVTTPGGGSGVDLELTMGANPTTVTQWGNIAFTATLTNNGTADASGVKVYFPKPSSVVFVGGNEVTVSQGSYSLFGNNIWTVGSVPAGSSATITVNWFVLENSAITGWAEVNAVTPADDDSTAGNGTCCSANEDDEASFTALLPGAGPQNQTINFPTIPDKESDDPDFTVSASAGSGLPVSLEIVSGPATISGNTISLDGTTGAVTIRATQAGNANWNAATPVERTFNVNPPGLDNQTINFPAIPNKQTTDAPFAISATASSGLPVTLEIVSGPATISGNTITLDGTAGAVIVKASQTGDAQYNPATDVQRTFTVNEPGQGGPDLELAVTSSSPTLLIWQYITFTIELTNNGDETASNIVVDVPIPQGLAYSSHNDIDGEYSNYYEEWEVVSLAAGETASMEIVLFCLQNSTPLPYFSQVVGQSPADLDSSPNNNTSGTPAEDDEALVTLLPAPNPLQSITGAVFSLSAKPINGITQLVWVSTVGEYATAYVVERSMNGFEWSRVLVRENEEHSNDLKTYYDFDAYPFPGWNYYRVRQVREDGSFLFSNVMMLEFWDDLYDYKLFPNPANDYVEVNLKGVEGQSVQLMLVDRGGRLVKKVEIDQATAATHILDLRAVPEGWYALWIQASNRKAKSLPLVIGKK